AHFEAPDAWPGLTRGHALFDAVAGVNLPAAGFVAAARESRHDLVPLTWCSAQPSGRVTREAFEHVTALLLEDLRAAPALDAVYLDLHGAMVAEHVDDADGEVLRRVRAVMGPDVPIVASLDYHANVSALMAQQASALVAYKTYPHVDMADCGARAARCLHDLLGKPRPATAFEALDFLIPLTSQSTLAPPMQDLAALSVQLERPPLLAVNVAPGFPAADVVDCGPSVYACGWDAASVRQACRRMVDEMRAREGDFALELYTVEQACHLAQSFAAPRGRPLILADTQDNPGAGGNADTTALIKALHEARVPRVLAGVLCDPLAAARAHAAGVGGRVDLALGGRSGPPGEQPLAARFDVLALGDGHFIGTGPFYRGGRFELGPMALLRLDDLHVAVASRKQQAADQAMFRHVGAEPADFAVLALKSSVHFRADFGPIASRILVVEAPGPNVADPAKLPFTRLRFGLRIART
ncbi:MAG: MlrC domain protein, partial [Steroidobacteraceae bacterium]|nr:MlrC domain protein [Steroidobacteraceae bacterium]